MIPTFAAVLGATLLALAALAAPAALAQSAQKPAPRPQPRSDLAPGAIKAVEERDPVDNEPHHALSPAELEVARAVHTGTMRCELGVTVQVRATRREGFFMVTTSKGQRFFMHPAESRTGAVRLEDPRRGAMWLQLGNKSMLMNQRQGQRLADECQSPEQEGVAEELRRNPRPSILDAPAPAASAASMPTR